MRSDRLDFHAQLSAPHRSLNLDRVRSHVLPAKADDFRRPKPDECEGHDRAFGAFQNCEDSPHLNRSVVFCLLRWLRVHAAFRIANWIPVNAAVADSMCEYARQQRANVLQRCGSHRRRQLSQKSGGVKWFVLRQPHLADVIFDTRRPEF